MEGRMSDAERKRRIISFLDSTVGQNDKIFEGPSAYDLAIALSQRALITAFGRLVIL
jgi:hypothetical protein